MDRNPTLAKSLIFCGLLGPLLFVTTFLIEGYLRPDYNPMLHPVSSLAIGERGWIQQLNFILTGSLILCFSFGMQTMKSGLSIPAKAPFVSSLIGMGLIGAGICTTDPVYGYPEDMPLKLAQFTFRGHLHDLFSIRRFHLPTYSLFQIQKII